MSTLPEPPPGWPARLTVALQAIIIQLRNDLSGINVRTTRAGRLNLSVATLPLIGEVKANGAVYTRAGLPELFKVCGTTFNTGGESAQQFRVPNITTGIAGVEWRISTG